MSVLCVFLCQTQPLAGVGAAFCLRAGRPRTPDQILSSEEQPGPRVQLKCLRSSLEDCTG